MSYVKDVTMKARKNPTTEQLAKRMWRNYPDSNPGLPVENFPSRAKKDPYWALRIQGHQHSYAKRAFRDQPPVIRQRTASADTGEYACDPEDILFSPGSTRTEIEVEIRPELSESSIRNFVPRGKEDYLWDNVVPGFAVRVRKTGYKCYVVFYRVRHSKRLRKSTIGNIEECSLEQARNMARNIRWAARMGNDPAPSQ